ncbi:low-density lipoprotein receptor-related protein 4-like [Mya arenaria]|uniref:low-density lipoprotein receptor-related protein 4-like n=1 Tax=Mya arenaria TaxID=6604 RepID=UPI0022E5B587|nr:low-density lipoprotein receptor-related protein 4-like [Mya arenaria]
MASATKLCLFVTICFGALCCIAVDGEKTADIVYDVLSSRLDDHVFDLKADILKIDKSTKKVLNDLEHRMAAVELKLGNIEEMVDKNSEKNALKGNGVTNNDLHTLLETKISSTVARAFKSEKKNILNIKQNSDIGLQKLSKEINDMEKAFNKEIMSFRQNCSNSCSGDIDARGKQAIGFVKNAVTKRPGGIVTQAITLRPIEEEFLVFTDSLKHAIYRMDINTQTYTKIVQLRPELSSPIAIDFDHVTQNVYFTDVKLKLIIRSSTDGGKLNIANQLSTKSVPDGLAIDSLSRLLFFSDVGNGIISVISLENNRTAAVIDEGLQRPRAIALNKVHKKIYWTDWGDNPKIERSNYDGSDRGVIVATGLKFPNAIALDTAHDIIYWADAGTWKIESANTDGSNRKVVALNLLSHLFGLALYKDNLFYTDWTQKSVMVLSTKSGQPARAFGKASFGRLNDIHVISPQENDNVRDACRKNNGGCDHICLPLARGRTCICQEGFELQTDKISCRSNVKIRLAGTKSASQGRIEISVNNGVTWGKICNDRFDDKDANVVCGMLGFQRSHAIPKDSSYFGDTSTGISVVLDDVDCKGKEESVLECMHAPLGTSHCLSNTDAGVICATDGQLYLSKSRSQGQLEIFLNNRWGSVCDDNFGTTEANVVCGMLGLSRSGAVVKPGAVFGQVATTNSSILLDDVSCSGSESNIIQCRHNAIGVSDCGQSEAVGVICQN